MTERLVTVANYATPTEASIAKNRLESAGVKAFLADNFTVGLFWHLANAVDGIKLQVAEEQAEEARAILTQPQQFDSQEFDTAWQSPPMEGEVLEPESAAEGKLEEPEETEEKSTAREQDADRALRGAILGVLFFPLQVYVFYLLLFRVFMSDEPLRGRRKRSAMIAAIINLPYVVVFCLFVRWLFSA